MPSCHRHQGRCSRSAGRRRHREDHHLWQHRRCLVHWLAGVGVLLAGPRVSTRRVTNSRVTVDDLDQDGPQELPSTLSSYLPIVVPILLIGAQSVVTLAFPDGHILRTVCIWDGQ